MYIKEKFDNSQEKNVQRNMMSKTLDSTNFNSNTHSSHNTNLVVNFDKEDMKSGMERLHRRSTSIPYHITFNASREINCTKKHHDHDHEHHGSKDMISKKNHTRSSSYFNPKINSYTSNNKNNLARSNSKSKNFVKGKMREKNNKYNRTFDNGFGHREQSKITEEENTEDVQ